jgi:hypothetical protein
MVRYTVKSDRAAENERRVKAIYAQLASERPHGLRYATFKLEGGEPDDGVSFVHLVTHESDGDNPLPELAAFKAFIAQIEDRYEEPAVTVEIHEIGAYAFFAS